MGLLIDVIIIAIIVLSTYLAYRKGLAALAIKLCAVIISIFVTLILYRPISNFIINVTNIDETIEDVVLQKSFELMNKGDENDEITQSVVEQVKNDAMAQTARELSIQIINVCVMLILFFGIKFALRFVTAIANKVANLPIINKFNKAGGIIYGILRGLIIVYACLLLIGFVGQVDSKNFLHTNIEKSSLGKAMYENNLFNALL